MRRVSHGHDHFRSGKGVNVEGAPYQSRERVVERRLDRDAVRVDNDDAGDVLGVRDPAQDLVQVDLQHFSRAAGHNKRAGLGKTPLKSISLLPFTMPVEREV